MGSNTNILLHSYIKYLNELSKDEQNQEIIDKIKTISNELKTIIKQEKEELNFDDTVNLGINIQYI